MWVDLCVVEAYALQSSLEVSALETAAAQRVLLTIHQLPCCPPSDAAAHELQRILAVATPVLPTWSTESCHAGLSATRLCAFGALQADTALQTARLHSLCTSP